MPVCSSLLCTSLLLSSALLRLPLRACILHILSVLHNPRHAASTPCCQKRMALSAGDGLFSICTQQSINLMLSSLLHQSCISRARCTHAPVLPLACSCFVNDMLSSKNQHTFLLFRLLFYVMPQARMIKVRCIDRSRPIDGSRPDSKDGVSAEDARWVGYNFN